MRELDRWTAARAALTPSHLDSGYHSAEIWFERWPWPFPLGVRRRMVQRLVELHDSWLPQLQAMGEPFYLGLWIFEPDFRESQLCAAVEHRAEDYAQRHLVGERVPPPVQYQLRPCDLGRFEWTRQTYTDRAVLAPDDDDLPVQRRAASRAERTPEGVVLTWQREAWFGWCPESRRR